MGKIADIFRNLNTYGKSAGFNITSDEPIDSRMFVNEIDQVKDKRNWTDVKPYNGLIVSDMAGNVRVCIDAAHYDKDKSWRIINDGAIEATNYDDAVRLIEVLGLPVGKIIDVKSPQEKAKVTYAAGLYVVASGSSLLYLATSTGTGEDISTLAGKVATLEGDMKNKVGSITVGGEILTTTDGAVTITYDDAVLEDSESMKALTHRAVATYLKSLKTELHQEITAIPKFKIKVVAELPKGGEADPIDPYTIYLVKDGAEGKDLYTEYIYLPDEGEAAGTWEILGAQKVNLDGYLKESALGTKLTALGYKTLDETKNELNTVYVSQETYNTEIAKINKAIEAKADTTYVDEQLKLKADASALAEKANTADVDDKLALKANTADVDDKLAKKADASALAGKADNSTVTELSQKVNTVESTLSTKADTAAIEAALAEKADNSTVENLTNTLSSDYLKKSDIGSIPTQDIEGLS